MLEFFAQHNLTGILIGLCSFLIIGLFHPLVIKGEYYFGVKCWWCFLVGGLVAMAVSVYCRDFFWQTLWAVIAFSCFWSILEVFEQRKRVEKGWFPRRPSRKK